MVRGRRGRAQNYSNYMPKTIDEQILITENEPNMEPDCIEIKMFVGLAVLVLVGVLIYLV